MSEVSVVLGIPHRGSELPAYFMDSVFSLDVPQGTRIIREQNKPVDIARELIAETFMDFPDATHLFFMDTDMSFPREVVLRLVQRDLPIVAGVYFARAGIPVPHFYRFDHQENPDGSCPVGKEHKEIRANGRWYRPLGNHLTAFLKAHPETAEEPSVTVRPMGDLDLLEVDAVGTGCLLIRRDVFETVERPWFKCLDDSGGEDFYFCQKAQAAGFPVMVDMSVMCAHEFRPRFITREDFEIGFRARTDDPHDFENDEEGFIFDVGIGEPDLVRVADMELVG